GWPLNGVTVTWKSTPACEEVEAEACFELMVAFVRRPTTADGLTTNTLPLPLDVLIVVLSDVTVPPTPPVSAPFDEFTTHCMGRLAKLKLPLLCAKPTGAFNAAITNIVATSIVFFMMISTPFSFLDYFYLSCDFSAEFVARGLPG